MSKNSQLVVLKYNGSVLSIKIRLKWEKTIVRRTFTLVFEMINYASIYVFHLVFLSYILFICFSFIDIKRDQVQRKHTHKYV